MRHLELLLFPGLPPLSGPFSCLPIKQGIPQTQADPQCNLKPEPPLQSSAASQKAESSRGRRSTPPQPSWLDRTPVNTNAHITNQWPDTASNRVEAPAPVITDGIVPKWIQLPHFILQQIFSYAIRTRPGQFRPSNASALWLVAVACLNKALLEPALAALYYSPPLNGGSQAFKLFELLSSDEPEKHMIKYETKIKRFDIEMESCLLHSTPGHGVFDLAVLIPFTTQLQTINVWSRYDLPQYRSQNTHNRCNIGNEIFRVLEENDLSLKSWHWKGKSQETGASKLRTASLLTESFKFDHSKLEEAGFTDFENDYFGGNTATFPKITDFCSTLPALRTVTFSKCAVDSESLIALPKFLTRLTFVDCDTLDSAILDQFLLSHGKSLTELDLQNNRNLNLSFLANLKAACPKLEALSVDLTYYSTLQSTDETEPGYLSLLYDDEYPTWPTTLQFLEILHLRKWTATAARNFFESLVEASRSLPDLRKLVISASVNDLGWKQRAAFRDEWENKLKRVFLRKPQPPNPYWMSKRSYRLWKEKKQRKGIIDSNERAAVKNEGSDVELPIRGHGNHRNNKQLPTPQPSQSASARSLRSKRKTSEPSEESDVPHAPSSLKGRVMKVLGEHAQGMCDVVDVRIDNLRPRENQLDESAFLDSERSGDEDYVDGQDEFEEGERYAW